MQNYQQTFLRTTSRSALASTTLALSKFPPENQLLASGTISNCMNILRDRQLLKMEKPLGVQLLHRPTSYTLSYSPTVRLVRKVFACCKVALWLRSRVMKFGTLWQGERESMRYIALRTGSPTFLRPNLSGSSVIECRAWDSLTKLKRSSGVAPKYSYLKIIRRWQGKRVLRLLSENLNDSRIFPLESLTLMMIGFEGLPLTRPPQAHKGLILSFIDRLRKIERPQTVQTKNQLPIQKLKPQCTSTRRRSSSSSSSQDQLLDSLYASSQKSSSSSCPTSLETSVFSCFVRPSGMASYCFCLQTLRCAKPKQTCLPSTSCYSFISPSKATSPSKSNTYWLTDPPPTILTFLSRPASHNLSQNMLSSSMAMGWN